MSNTREQRIGLWLALGAATGFSMKAVFVKLSYMVAPVSAVTLLSLRMSFTLPFVLWSLYSLRHTAKPLTPKDWWLLLVLGLLGYYGASILDFLGLQYISAGLERLILFTYPTLTVLFGMVFFGRSLERRQIAALALSYVGIGLVFVHDWRFAEDTQALLIGAGFVFASAVSYALYSVGAEFAIARLGAARFSALGLMVSAAATQLHFCLSQPWSALIQPLPVYAYGLAMAVFSTVLPVYWQSAAMQRIGVARVVLIGTLGPILTLFLGFWLLGEAVSLIQLAGASLVVGGVLLVSKMK